MLFSIVVNTNKLPENGVVMVLLRMSMQKIVLDLKNVMVLRVRAACEGWIVTSG